MYDASVASWGRDRLFMNWNRAKIAQGDTRDKRGKAQQVARVAQPQGTYYIHMYSTVKYPNLSAHV